MPSSGKIELATHLLDAKLYGIQSCRQVLLPFETIPARVGWGVVGKHVVIMLFQP